MIQRVPIGSLPECLACSCLQSEGQELGGFLKYQVDFIKQQRQRSSLVKQDYSILHFFPLSHTLTRLQGNFAKGSVW